MLAEKDSKKQALVRHCRQPGKNFLSKFSE